jgi:hypothetical protein
MGETFKNYMDKRIIEIRERIHINRLKKKVELITFSKRLEKAWKNINEIKPN